MQIQTISSQNFSAKLIGFKPIIARASEEGLTKTSIDRALNKIQKYFPDRDDSIIVTEKYNIFFNPTEIGVLNKNGVYRATEVNLDNNRNDLYKIVSAVKKLSTAKFTEDLNFKIIEK